MGLSHFRDTCLNIDNALITNNQSEKLGNLKIYFYSIIPQNNSDMDLIQKRLFLRGAAVLPKLKSLKHIVF